MAETIYGTLTHRLLSPVDLVAKLDPWRVAFALEQPLRAAAEDITREVAAQLYEVATAYGDMIVDNVITARNIFESALTGRMSDRLMNLVSEHVQRLVDQQAGVAHPLLVLVVGGRRVQQIKAEMSARLIARLPDLLRPVFEQDERKLIAVGALLGFLVACLCRAPRDRRRSVACKLTAERRGASTTWPCRAGARSARTGAARQR